MRKVCGGDCSSKYRKKTPVTSSEREARRLLAQILSYQGNTGRFITSNNLVLLWQKQSRGGVLLPDDAEKREINCMKLYL